MKIRDYLMAAFVTVALWACDDYDDSALWEKVNSNTERIEELESWQEQMDNNLRALQQLISVQDYITSVETVTDGGETVGYTIRFKTANPITIYNGTSSHMSITMGNDSKWYWTLDDEILIDSDGNPVSAMDVAPQVSIGTELFEAGVSNDAEGNPVSVEQTYVSVDGGKNWYRVTGTDEGSFFQKVDISNEDFVIFVLDNEEGTRIVVPRGGNKLLLIQEGKPLTDLTALVCIAKGDLTYTAPEGMQVSARILEGEGWTATIEDNAIKLETGTGSALLEITLTDNGKVLETYRLTVNLYSGGEGTEANPYQISSAEELVYLSGQTNEGKTLENTYFKLTDDIDLDGIEYTRMAQFSGTLDGDGHGIEYTRMAQFSGTLDGDGHTIRNMHIEYKGANHLALIAVLTGTVRNLHVEGVVKKEMKTTAERIVQRVAGIVGANNGGLVENCTFKGSIIHTAEIQQAGILDYVGGVVGHNMNGGIIKGCAYLGSPDGQIYVDEAYVGGVVFQCDAGCYVIGCYNTGKIVTTQNTYSTGGVVGDMGDTGGANIVGCYNTGVIVAGDDKPVRGGIIGNNMHSNNAVTACYNVTDEQSPNIYLIGYTSLQNPPTTIFNTCYWVNVDGCQPFACGNLNENLANSFTACSAKTADELKSQATVDALNTAIATWNSSHENRCNYLFAADPAGGYPILVSQD